MKKYCVSLLFLFLTSCANPFMVHYVDTTGGIDITKSPVAIISNDVQLYRSSDPQADGEKMLTEGYGLIGYSQFNDRLKAIYDYPALVKEQGQNVHAAVVYLYMKYLGGASGVIPYFMPTTQTSMSTFGGNAWGTGGFVNFSGTGLTTTYGTQTMLMPYTMRFFSFLATYWGKKKPPVPQAFPPKVDIDVWVVGMK